MPSIPDSLKDLPYEPPHNFLGLDEAGSDFESAGAVIMPVPYEATVSYGSGTARGPGAIIDASRYIELYDQELDSEPADVGVATLPALSLTRGDPEQAITQLGEAYERVLDAAGERFVIVLGGEHSISSAPILTWADRLEQDGRRLTVLQVDAHTDLRDEYEGTEYSHASVMARVLGRVDIVSVGIRALTSEERELVRSRDDVTMFLADEIHGRLDWIDEVVAALGDDVYITFDVDGLDPSLVPTTGTPEPGGLLWYDAIGLLRQVFQSRNVVGADVVELAPSPGQSAPEFLIAKLVYKMIGYRFSSGSVR
ncbi:MAG TPA: agmatinase [Longimicrobiales bacterium]|nr:agmatinase [Longimicrobiales bacterium]